jgi:general stress protein 26
MKKGYFKFYQELLKRNFICTLATASLKGKPEAATMLYAEKDDGNLYLYCFNDARKYPNIVENPRASIVIFNSPDYLQMDGTFTELSKKEAIIARTKLIEKHGNKEDYHADSRCRYFCFKPKWISIRVEHDYPAKYATLKADKSDEWIVEER